MALNHLDRRILLCVLNDPRNFAVDVGEAPYLGPSLGDRVLEEQKLAQPKSFHEVQAEDPRAKSLRMMLKRKRTKQPAGRCRCGRVIPGNKRYCLACAPEVC